MPTLEKVPLAIVSQAYSQLVSRWIEAHPFQQQTGVFWGAANEQFRQELDRLLTEMGWKEREFWIESRKEAKAICLLLKEEAARTQEFP